MNPPCSGRFSAAFDPESESDPSPSGLSTYESAEERPSPIELEETSPRPDNEEPEDEPLASSFLLGEFEPHEPRSEISQPALNLFAAILNRNPPRTRQMATVTATMTTNHLKEIRFNPLKVFNGDRKTFRKFLQDVEVYLLINQEVYDNDLKKIGYVLSFMTEGQAAAWAAQFVETGLSKKVTGTLALGTYQNFYNELVAAFSKYNSPGEALDQMKNLRMKNEDSTSGTNVWAVAACHGML